MILYEFVDCLMLTLVLSFLLALCASFKSLLIILASGPWFSTLTSPHLWQEMPMEVDDLQGEQELVGAILAVVDGTEIQVRLRQSPQLLWRAGGCFRSHKQEALRILATLPFAQALSFWRHSLFIQALNPQKDLNALVEENDEVRSLQLTAVEALACHQMSLPTMVLIQH
jgi:hypothetical protein